MNNDILLTPSPTPEFTASLPAYTTQTVVHPDTFNPVHQTLLDNDKALQNELAAVDGQVEDLQQRIADVEQTSAVDISRAVELDWLYRGNRIAIEFFTNTTTLVSHLGVSILSGIAGDDSIDVASTAQIVVGGDYLLRNAESGIAAELVRVTAVLNGNRLRLSRNLNASYDQGDSLSGSTLQARDAGGVTGLEGAQWVSGPINLGETPAQRAVVIRRSLNAGEVKLFFRDAFTPEWTERYWSTRRTAGGAGAEIPAGFADYEYVIALRGNGYLRAEVEGEPVDILHIVAIGGPTGLGGYVNPLMRPAAPAVENPANAAVGVNERPTLTANGFNSPAGNAFAAAQFQISTSATLATVLHDSGEVAALTYAMPASVLAANTVHYVRVRVKDVAGLVSDWSAITTFTTKASYAYANTPALVSPANGQSELPEQPTLQSGAFAATGSADTHASSQWQVRTLNGAWSAPLHDSGESATAKTSYTMPAGVLASGQRQYVARVRHKGATLGWSEWSSDVTFTTKQQFAQMLGIVMTASGGGAGQWARIDENFSAITTTTATFSNHATYAGIVDQTVDGQAMVKVPKFYVKTGTVPSGAYAGKRFWMVSDLPAAGFELHPAFKAAGENIEQFWVGKYQGTDDGAKLGSKSGVNPLVSINFPTMQARAEARNTAGVSGFALWNIYQLAAIQTLCLIEMGGADSQTLIGQGNVSSNTVLAVSHATVAQATWRGIVGLWGNVYQMVDGLQTDASARLKVWDKNGNQTYQTASAVAPGNGWIATLSADAGANHDMAKLFAPATTDSAQSNGSLGDYLYQNPSCVAYHGGLYSHGANAGLFALGITNTATHSNTYFGGRLAKV